MLYRPVIAHQRPSVVFTHRSWGWVEVTSFFALSQPLFAHTLWLFCTVCCGSSSLPSLLLSWGVREMQRMKKWAKKMPAWGVDQKLSKSIINFILTGICDFYSTLLIFRPIRSIYAEYWSLYIVNMEETWIRCVTEHWFCFSTVTAVSMYWKSTHLLLEKASFNDQNASLKPASRYILY